LIPEFAEEGAAEQKQSAAVMRCQKTACQPGRKFIEGDFLP
jgi:hypothetical protein